MKRRFALIQALFSLVALAAVIWWASKQDAPTFPSDAASYAWLGAALGLYAIATMLRGERWHRILAVTGVRTGRVDCYALTTVGYMGNNVLPARVAAAVALWFLRGHHVFDRARDWLRPLADAPRALLGSEGAGLLVGTFVIWAFEAAVYLAVARSVDLDFSMTGALYLVALTNFVAA